MSANKVAVIRNSYIYEYEDNGFFVEYDSKEKMASVFDNKGWTAEVTGFFICDLQPGKDVTLQDFEEKAKLILKLGPYGFDLYEKTLAMEREKRIAFTKDVEKLLDILTPLLNKKINSIKDLREGTTKC